MAAPIARADTFVDGREFGMHVSRIANGVLPTVSYGSVRLWDAGVACPDPVRAGLHAHLGGVAQVAGHLPEQGTGLESAPSGWERRDRWRASRWRR
jgi:hypothetical protein